LRLADGEPWNENTSLHDAMDRITRGGLAGYPLAGNEFGEGGLTPLGREVAEMLRPKPWQPEQIGAWVALVRPDGSALEFAKALTEGVAMFQFGEATRIAALLTADDLRTAKRYRTG
jgi:hypothetical protein